MNNTTNTSVLKIMNIIFWIVFVGLCIKTGALLVSFYVSVFVNAAAAKDLYMGFDLYELYSFDKGYYIAIASLVIFLSVMKSYIAYLVVKMFMKFDLAKPFTGLITDLFLKISYVAICAGVLATIGSNYSKWLMKKGVSIPVDWSHEEILFFAGVIYIIALVFKKGTELQTENDLTV